MHEGDEIEEIDHAPVTRGAMTLRDVVERLRGVEGTKVTLLSATRIPKQSARSRLCVCR